MTTTAVQPSFAVNTSYPSCRCCGAANTFHRGRKFGTFKQHTFDYYGCRECDFLFVEPFPGYDVYNDAYYRGEGPDPYVNYEVEYLDYRKTHRLIEFEDLAQVAEQFWASRSGASTVTWLDYGCGAGGFIKYLTDRRELRRSGGANSIQVAGHDLGTYAEKLKSDGYKILNAEELLALPDGTFDIISMIEVIEHIEYPARALSDAARLLKPGGLLILTTGNMASPVANRLGLNYAYLIPEIHVSLFTSRCLDMLYQRHGLSSSLVHYKGVVRFKVLKTLRSGFLRGIAAMALRLPFVIRLLDRLYGVSAMPCASKR